MRQGLFTAIIAGIVLVTSLAWAGSPDGVPSTGINEKKTPELVKTIPISRKGEPKTIVQVQGDDFPTVKPGDTVEVFSEVEVSVTCLEPDPACVGKRYTFSPKVEASVVLANGTSRRGLRIGEAERITCSQDLPNRNHHCVVTVHRKKTITQAPNCAPQCSLNLVVKASHPKAKRGNVLVIGTDTDNGIDQNRAALSAGVFSPDETYDPRLIKTTNRVVRNVDVHPSDTKEVTVASVKLERLTQGEVLAIDAKAVASIGHLPYNTLTQGQIVLSEKRLSSDNHGIPLSVATRNGNLTSKNGFNCTQGRSGFATPCAIEKGSFVRIKANSRKHPNQNDGRWVPLYVNFFVGFDDVYTTGRKYRPGDKAKIKSVRLEIRRYSP